MVAVRAAVVGPGGSRDAVGSAVVPHRGPPRAVATRAGRRAGARVAGLRGARPQIIPACRRDRERIGARLRQWPRRTRGLLDHQEFAAESAVDAFRDTPLMTCSPLRGKDVVLTFVESYRPRTR